MPNACILWYYTLMNKATEMSQVSRVTALELHFQDIAGRWLKQKIGREEEGRQNL